MQKPSHHNLEDPHLPSKYRQNLCPSLGANPHHRHLRKNASKQRKNMSFTNEEVRVIDRDNSNLLEKLLAVDNREDLTTHNRTPINKPASATINRRRQEENIRKDNLALLRRLQETKPSRNVQNSSRTSNSSSNYHHHHHPRHHHHKSHHHHHNSTTIRSCSISARQSHGSPFSPAHHSPKETAL